MLKTQLQPQSPDTWSTLGPPDADSCSTSGQKTQAFPVTTQVCLTTLLASTELSLFGGWPREHRVAKCYQIITNNILEELWETGIRGGDLCLRLLGKVLTWKNPPGTERVRGKMHQTEEVREAGGEGLENKLVWVGRTSWDERVQLPYWMCWEFVSFPLGCETWRGMNLSNKVLLVQKTQVGDNMTSIPHQQAFMLPWAIGCVHFHSHRSIRRNKSCWG